MLIINSGAGYGTMGACPPGDERKPFMQPSLIWRHELSSQPGVCTLAISGELDLACVPALQSLLFEQVQAAEIAEIRVDLAQVTFLDSSALGVLVSGFNYARDEGCGFCVVDPSPQARRILAMTGLDEVLISD
jgi:anti-anti-sigma factor